MSNIYNETILINLNSKNSIQNNGTFLSDVYFNFKNILNDSPDVIATNISVTSAQIPYSFYNINVYNNVLAVDYNGTPYILTLTRGNYNATNLLNEISVQCINAGIPSITFSISSITGCLLITNGGAIPLYINTVDSTIYDVLGLTVGTNYTVDTTPLLVTQPLNLLGTLRLRIVSFELLSNNLDSSQMGAVAVLASIPIEAATFGIILYDNISGLSSKLLNTSLGGFDISILDDDDNLINFNGQNWTLQISITLTKKRIENNITNKTFNELLGLRAMVPEQTEQPNPEPEQTEQTEPEPEPEPPIDAPQNPDENSIDYLLYSGNPYKPFPKTI